MNIAELLASRADAAGDCPAIVESSGTVSFAMLERWASAMAAQLAADGIAAGDRIVVLSPMSARLYALLAAIWRLGAVVVFVDPSAGRRHMTQCCAAIRPRAFVGVPQAHLLRLSTPALARLPMHFSLGQAIPFARTLRADHTSVRSTPVMALPAHAPALMTFTSGSTGEPKALTRTHGFLLDQYRAVASELALRAGDRDLATLPIFVLANLASGVTTVLAGSGRGGGPPSEATLIRRLLTTRPSRATVAPAYCDALIAAEHARPGALASIRQIYVGGAPVFPRLLRELAAVAPSAEITAVYGSSEAEPIACQRWSETTRADREAMTSGAGLLAGHPVHGLDVRIIPDASDRPLPAVTATQFDNQCLPPGTTGEIVVAGSHVLAGYADASLDRMTSVSVGGRIWHRTGDAGTFDARGRVWLAGRCASKAQDARGTLYPLAVESAALEIDGVRRCAVLAGGPGRRLVVEAVDGADFDDVERSVRRTLEWAHIDAVVFVDAIPLDRRHRSKVDYPALRRLVA